MTWWNLILMLLLLMALDTGAELLLLKHENDLYCVTDDSDTPALAWNFNFQDARPQETVEWWPRVASYSEMNCKPQLGTDRCGNWITAGWTIVKNHWGDLPPIFDFRWNDLKLNAESKGKNIPFLKTYATFLNLPLSLLVQDNAIVVLKNENNAWRFVIDGWITSKPRREIEWISDGKIENNSDCPDCDGAILHNGTRWITLTLKYVARSTGDVLTLYNHDTQITNIWTPGPTLIRVKDVSSFIHPDSTSASLGHWRFHSYNILQPPKNNAPMTLHLKAQNVNQICISITYYAPQTTSVGFIQLKIRQGNTEIKNERLEPTGNEWKTVKYIITVQNSGDYVLYIYPPRMVYSRFAIGEIRACSEQGFRVSKIASSAASECTDLKHNKSVNLKPVYTNNQDPSRPLLPTNYNSLCAEIIPRVQSCLGVTFCSSSICSCAPGYQGPQCEQVCPSETFGIGCSSVCHRHCKNNETCSHVTGECPNGCADGWQEPECTSVESSSSKEGNSNGKVPENTNVNSNGNEPDYMGWLLLIPITLTICVLMYWRRKAIRKRFREIRLRSQGSTTNEASSINMLPPNPPRASTSTPPTISPPVQLDVPPPVQPRMNVPPPVQPRMDVPPPLIPRQSSVPPAQEKPSLLVPLFDLANYIQNAVASGQLAAQHATFPRGLTAPTVEAERKEHKGKNRWRNVLPYDFSRVVLESLPLKPHSHYINASYIDGYMKEKAFIATQGPRAETVDDFWRLVWQKNVSCIIMLCNLTEGQTMKCEKYWPAVGSSAHHKDELQVRTDSEDAFLDHVVRILSVSRGKNGASRTVTQLHYTAWPDHGVPRYAHSLASVLRQVPLDGDAPILVHCSAGVGRTGTVILALAGYVMGQAEGVVDMLALLAKMRSQRPNMVDNAGIGQKWKFLNIQLLVKMKFMWKSMAFNFVDSIDDIDNSSNYLEQNSSLQSTSSYESQETQNNYHENEENVSDTEIVTEEMETYDVADHNLLDSEEFDDVVLDTSFDEYRHESEEENNTDSDVVMGEPLDETGDANEETHTRNMKEQRTKTVKRLKNRSFGRELNEYNREQGKEYQSVKVIDGVRTLITRKARSMGPPCNSEKCQKFTHCQQFSHSEREEIFNQFWKLSLSQKKIYLRSIVDVVPTKSSTRNLVSKHMDSRHIYHLKINGTSKRVCLQFFMSTLALKFTQLNNWLDPKKDTAKNDRTQPATSPTNRYDVAQSFVRDKFNELPRVPSHFCRADTDKQFLQSDFKSIRDVHATLSSDAIKAGVPTVSWSKFHEIFTSTKLAVHELRKDACYDCTAIRLKLKRTDLTEEEKEELDQKLLAHKASYQRARQEKNNDKKSNDNVLAFVCDLQKVFNCPLLNNNLQFYLSKLQVRNWTCFQLKQRAGKKRATCQLWDETNGSVDASDFASLWYLYIVKQLRLDPDINEVIAWSDGCCAQNRNTTLANALLHLAILTGITIVQKFFVKGHSFNEGDTMHSRIEKILRNFLLYTIEQIAAEIRNARVINPTNTTDPEPEQYDVEVMSFSDFTDYKKVTYYKSIRPGVGVGSPTVNNIRALQYLPNGTINYKLNFDDEWQELPHKNAQPTSSVSPKYTSRLAINELKFQHLQRLKPFIPQELHQFYDDLPHND